MDLSICICTARRPMLLDKLLNALSEHDMAGRQVEIVVVDNDPNATGLPVANHWKALLPIPLTTVHVPVPNISSARNAALHNAHGEFVLLIDDDECPDPGWVSRMLTTQQQHKADAVFGPVRPNYREDTPDWIRQGNFFAPRSHATGTRLLPYQCYTGNTLIRRELALRIPGPFDLAFGITGGEDVMFFSDLARLGAILIWCDEASVSEDIASQRTNLRWIVRRAFWGGQTLVRTQLNRLGFWPRTRLVIYHGTRASVQLLAAGAIALMLRPFSSIHSARWLCTAAAQAGKLSAIFGRHNREYAS